MGIQINGNNDIISALDGSWTAEGASINTSGILTATTFKGNVTGTACTFVDGKFTGNVTIGGTLTYEDVTNIDSVGIITARGGIIDSTLTAGRVVYVDSDKSLTDSANLTFNGNNVTLEEGRLFVKRSTIPSVDVRNSTNTSYSRVILQQGAAEGGYFQISREGTNSTANAGANSVELNQSSNHPLTIKTNNTERLRITGAGNVGIGTAIPGAEFEVRGAGTVALFQGTGGNAFIGLTDLDAGAGVGYIGSDGGDLLFQTPGSSYSTKLQIKSDGRLVVGHTAAIGDFHGPYGTTNRNPHFQIHGTNISNASMSLTSWDNNVVGYYGPGIFLARSGSSTKGTNSRVTNINTILGSIIFSGDDGTDFVKGAMIQAAVDTSTGDNDMPARLQFLTTPDGAQEPIERLRIHADGEVAIAAAANGQTVLSCLGAYASSSTVDIQTWARSDSAVKAAMKYSHGTNSMNFGTTTNHPLIFQVNNTEKVRINSTGDVTFTGADTSFATIMYTSNFCKLDLRGTGIANSYHYILSYGAGHANADDFHMVNKTTNGNLTFRTGSAATARVKVYPSGKVTINPYNTFHDPTHQPTLTLSNESESNLYEGGKWSHAAIGINNTTHTASGGSKSQIVFGYLPRSGGYDFTYGSGYIGATSVSQSGAGKVDLVFGTKDVTTDTQPTERLRITSDGTLLVNTSNTDNLTTGGMKIQTASVNGISWALNLRNPDVTAAANAAVGILFNMDRSPSGGIHFQAGSILVRKNQNWTTSATTIESDMVFGVQKDESLVNRFIIYADGMTETNGVHEFNAAFMLSNNTAYNWDINVESEGSRGNSFYVVAGYNHFHTTSYGAHLVGFYCARQTSITRNANIADVSHSNAGQWSVSKSDNNTLRVTKSAGSYGGTGYGFIRVTFQQL